MEMFEQQLKKMLADWEETRKEWRRQEDEFKETRKEWRKNDIEASVERMLDRLENLNDHMTTFRIRFMTDDLQVLIPNEAVQKFKEASDKMAKMVKEMEGTNEGIEERVEAKTTEGVETVSEMKSAEQMISLTQNMENGQRIEFLEYLFHAHFDSRFKDDYDLATKHEIEDVLDRDLTEDELLAMKIAYGNGYFRGGKDGMDKVLRGYAEK